MSVDHPDPDDLRCQELVELVTEYLEGALEPALRARFERHLASCDACVVYVDQIRVTIATLGVARDEPLEPRMRDALLLAFREFKRGHASA